jgi:hypothetical protein
MAQIDTVTWKTVGGPTSSYGTGVSSSYLRGVIRATIRSLGAYVFVNSQALFIPEPSTYPRESCTLSKKIAAIQLVPTGDGDGKARLGTISQLSPGTRLNVCGDGFNEQTVKVRCEGAFYFVFWQDIAAETARLQDGI